MTDTAALALHSPSQDVGVTRILVVMAHPDDIDFSVAGSIAKWRAAGIKVTYLLATRGDAGGFDDTPREQMPILREAEQRAAAAEVGVEDVRFLGYADGSVQVTLELRQDIARVIRQVRPERVITASPNRNFQSIAASHPDHLAVGEATLCAVYPDARNAFAFPSLLSEEGLEPWSVDEVWTVSSDDANRAVEVTDFFAAKLSALAAHVSQTAHVPELAGFLRSRLAGFGTAAGLPEGGLAEVFQVIKTR